MRPVINKGLLMWGKNTILIILLAATVTFQTQAQDECELVLAQAAEEFNAGHLYGISAMLKDCLDKNQNREWRQRAYLLLSETYLLLEDPVGAEQSYLNVLRANPEYLTDQTRDPIDLVYLSGKFTATPIFSFHAFAGPNISPVRVIHDVRIGGEPYSKESYLIKSLGWHFGAGMDFNYNDYLSATAGFTMALTKYNHRTTDLFGVNKDVVEVFDRQTWLQVPLSVKYCQSKGKIRRYGYAGYSFNILLTDRANIEMKNRDAKEGDVSGGEFSTFDKSISNLNLKDNRELLNGAFFVGGGVKYKYKLDYFFVDLRYSFGMKNLTKAENRFNSVSEGLPYPYVDDDIRLDNLAISVGYIHPLYKPRKLKKARTKSVLRKIEKEDNETN